MKSNVEDAGAPSKTPLTDLIDDIVADAHGGELSLGDILDDLGDRSYGPLFFILGLIIITPIGAVPGVPIVIGLVLVILAVEFVIGQRHPWMPKRLRELSVSAEKMHEARRKLGPTLRFIDRFVDERLQWMISRPLRIFAAISIILLSLAMIPLEFIPFGVAVPGAAIAAFGLAIVARDGLLMVIALGFVGGTGWLLKSAIALLTG